MKPSKILSVAPIFNSDPASVYIELSCSLCDEVDTLVVNHSLNERVTFVVATPQLISISFAVVTANGNQTKKGTLGSPLVGACFAERATGSSRGESPMSQF